MFATYAQTWYISAVAVLSALLMAWTSSRRNLAVVGDLEGAIASRDDLESVRTAINLSMVLALVYMGMVVLFMAALGACVFLGDMGWDVASLHLLIFGVVTLPPSLYARSTEKKIRALDVTAQDPEVERTFRQWLAMWNQARLTLPK